EEMRRICREVKAPLVANMIEGGRTPLLSVNELKSLGYRFILFPLTALLSAAYAIREMLSLLKADGLVATINSNSRGVERRMLIFDEFNKLIGLDNLKSIEARYARPTS
ncbi:MAG: hypothetical protein QXR04_00540, partial [Candidatus Nitrosocaldus sp.]